MAYTEEQKRAYRKRRAGDIAYAHKHGMSLREYDDYVERKGSSGCAYGPPSVKPYDYTKNGRRYARDRDGRVWNDSLGIWSDSPKAKPKSFLERLFG